MKNLKNEKFGRLLVLEKTDKRENKAIVWKCKCDCGSIYYVNSHHLLSNNTKSCGCIRKERNNNTKHNLSKTRLYRIYKNIKSRCYNSKVKAYKNYGGRNITICDEWKNSFEKFYNWAKENGYTEDLTIDRIDVDGNYEPNNCRWTTMKEQNNNRRNNKKAS